MNSDILLADQQQRLLALDPKQSFIMQAPAGSGKTTISVQRFLCLLNYVEKAPEEILAITFTRKAAAEMRTRIINALQDAAVKPKPTEAHASKIWELAKKVLQRDKQLNWNLLDNPNRLHIQTIDSLCSSLTQRMPILSKLGTQTKISDDQQALHQKAANETLLQIDADVPWANAIQQLLLHLNNNYSTAKKLLTSMLAKREQWLPYVHNQKIERAELEKGLKAIAKDCLEKLNNTAPKKLMNELICLAQFAASNCQDEKYKPPPSAIDISINNWMFLANILLTQNNTWRKQVTSPIGFPPPSSSKDKEQKILYKNMKDNMIALLEKISSHRTFQEALIELKHIPPEKYSDNQWQLLDALVTLLPIAAAQLKLVFRETGEVDFSEVSQAALAALGSPESPTNLALTLDYKIRHILVDEFQDTSGLQLNLLKLLTAGWQPDDGRTLFLVGDPMQSIYRFRNAEVGLFLRAYRDGIDNIQLTPLTLSVNFRSQKTIVEWINKTFTNVFPDYEDIAAGAVTYSPSIAAQNQPAKIKLHSLIDVDESTEALQIVELIKKIREDNPQEKIAILVRARTHLKAILPTLHANQLHYQAIEIDKLNTSSVVQDLLALTKALLHPADRIAWLAILRAPWCKLTLNDLYIIANKQPELTIWQQINNQNILKQLSSSGQPRLENFKNIVSQALKFRYRKNLRTWITDAWTSLNGPCYANNETDLHNAKAFFNLLETVTIGGDIPNFAILEEKINQLYITPTKSIDENLQIMTIHRAKGLEFDTVILPGLNRRPTRKETQLLLWMDRPRTHCENDLILAPIKNTKNNDPVYTYLSREERLRDKFEAIRLLYVAVTRAKKQLHLFGDINPLT
jgi:ATP-dependent helicase/nuclease subunit A